MNRRHANIHWVYVVMLALAIQNNAAAQIQESPSKRSPAFSLVNTIGGDVGRVFSSPFGMSSNSTFKLMGLAVLTAGLATSLDRSFDHGFAGRADGALGFPKNGLVTMGKGYDEISSLYFLAGLSTATLAGGLAFKDDKLLQTSRLLVESYFVTQAVTFLGKELFGRSRPYTGRSDFSLFNFGGSNDKHSFPSGHTSSAFAMMTVLAKQYDSWWVKIPAYTLATSVAIQRMESRNHWGSDVLVGGLIGYWVGGTLVNKHKSKLQMLPFEPYITGNGVGLSINF